MDKPFNTRKLFLQTVLITFDHEHTLSNSISLITLSNVQFQIIIYVEAGV